MFDDLRKEFDAVFIAIGAQGERKLGIPGEELDGVITGLGFLRELNMGREISLGKKVAVIGGGNVAVDAARSALRLGASQVYILRRLRPEMPAIESEVKEAERRARWNA